MIAPSPGHKQLDQLPARSGHWRDRLRAWPGSDALSSLHTFSATAVALARLLPGDSGPLKKTVAKITLRPLQLRQRRSQLRAFFRSFPLGG